MRYLSVCSGIEAASVAWHPLGWTPVAFAEIEKFPSAVLAHHYPHVPNWGDITKFRDWPDATIDLLIGGTPCQSFSVAGLRQGLADPRGNLALTYLAIADRYRPRWVAWENVPGVLSSDGGGALGAFLGGLGQLGYGFAYRVLDAQYFGLAQRRARVFVVGHLGDWRRAAAVLFERESLSGHPAPRREAGERVADSLTVGANQCSGTRSDFVEASTGPISHCLNAGGMGRLDYESETLIAHSLRAEGFDASEDGTGRGTPIVPIAFSAKDHGADAGDLAPTLRAGGHASSHANGGCMPAVAFAENQRGELVTSDTMGALKVGGGKPGQGYPAVAFDARQSDVIQYGDLSGPLDTDGHTIGVQSGYAVRRLTPRECEKLQGFLPDYTLIPYRGKPAADGPRYKALGNSMAVPVIRWIGERIQLLEQALRERVAGTGARARKEQARNMVGRDA
jgi:DNA (cytosine-5)-methyltransferase 1